MRIPDPRTPLEWLNAYCPSLDGQFLFLDPVSWQTHLLTPGAELVLREAALAIENGRFDAFLAEIEEAGGWQPGLAFLAHSLLHLHERNGISATR
ncbi:hypothetical protein CKCBHOJB_01049 [Thauera sp. GDN1]|uniref:hypothetical protein n=1 Tax=Thauera sp. GDN1 TaxID=2944810 RepID=UPI00247A0AC4|nr:hypothetical protein [Thauera sp. GDN1]WEN41496.1 hypothetical protein CKCBHOJB_01049 [Thauera sp. GDN1]